MQSNRESKESKQIESDLKNIESVIKAAGFQINYDGIGMFLEAQTKTRYVIPCMLKFAQKYPDLMKYYLHKKYEDSYKSFPWTRFKQDIQQYTASLGALNDLVMRGSVSYGHGSYDNPNNLLDRA
ncbi:hypothetical protein RsoM2USA_220 [Ralstonia phage RsoM2USA]|nr:hypothetical protein RsoM2USA_220 [Ralstonia phage RsoM2USA]